MSVVSFLVPAVVISLGGCSFTRSDLLEIASAQPDIRIIPDHTHSYSFGTVEVYDVSMKTFYIENQGKRTLQIEKLYTSQTDMQELVIDTTYTASNLEAGESTTFDLYFKPTSDIAISDYLHIESNDPDESIYTVNISGAGSWGSGTPPMMTVMQGSMPVNIDSVAYDFGPVHVGSSMFVDFTIMNDSRADYDLAVTGIRFKGGDIASFDRFVPSLPVSLSPGSDMQFSVEFLPGEVITYMTEMEIVTDDPDYSSFTFWVTGSGIAEPDIRVLDGLNEIPTDGTVVFGSMEYNQGEITKLITIENAGSVDLHISDIYVDDIDGDFMLASPVPIPDPFTVEPGGSEAIAIKFEPVSGLDMFLQAEIEIYSDDPDESIYHFYTEGYSESIQIPDINVRNETTEKDVPSLSLGHDFATVGIGSQMAALFKIENSGNADLTIFNIDLGGDTNEFYLSNTPILPVTIPSGGSVLFDAVYSPAGTGIHIASVYIENDDTDTIESPYIFDLQGRGTVIDVSDILVKVGSKKIFNNGIYYFNTDTEAVKYPGSIGKTFTIENKGKEDLVIFGVLIVSGDADDFSADLTTPITVKAGSSVGFTVNFSPQKAPEKLEERSTRLQLTNNDVDENPYIIDLVGWVEP